MGTVQCRAPKSVLSVHSLMSNWICVRRIPRVTPLAVTGTWLRQCCGVGTLPLTDCHLLSKQHAVSAVVCQVTRRVHAPTACVRRSTGTGRHSLSIPAWVWVCDTLAMGRLRAGTFWPGELSDWVLGLELGGVSGPRNLYAASCLARCADEDAYALAEIPVDCQRYLL